MVRKEWFDTLANVLLACEVSAETEDEKVLMSMLAGVLEQEAVFEKEEVTWTS